MSTVLTPEPITAESTRPVQRPVMYQSWNDISWLHWPYPPEVVQALLPTGVTVDTFDGQAWVGLVPFRMTRLRPPGLPPVPWLTTFPETNVRTYVIGPDGRRAVWFWSLDAPRAPAIAVARAVFGLPYCWAKASVDRIGDRITYQSVRRWPGPPVETAIEVQLGERLAPHELSDLDHFLTARFGLLTVRRGTLLHGPIEHPPWPLRRAAVSVLHDGLVAAAGLPGPGGSPHVLAADSVPVRVGRLEKIPAGGITDR